MQGRQNLRLIKTLRESENHFRSLVQSAPDAILSIYCSGDILLWNNAAEVVFGYTADQTIGKSIF